MKHFRQSFIRTVLFTLIVSLHALPSQAQTQQKTEAGEKRNDFAQLVARLSEKAGYFGSDNLVSNELTYQHVLGTLSKMNVSGGIYMGVGPDQNFTYIAQIKPKLAIMIDIRRDALLQHLMFKSIFMMSRSRIEYLSNLFGRPLPKDYKKWNDRPIRDLVDYFDRTPLDQKIADKVKAEMHKRIESFGVPLNQRDWETIDEIYQAFYTDCLEVRYTIRDRPTGRFFPAYRDLLLEKDLAGKYRNYLANEADFMVIKTMHDQHRIIPATGDVAGVKAIRAIGEFAKEINEKISAFYLSNVEFYLFRSDTMGRFVENLKYLPIDNRSVIIRSYFNYAYYTNQHPQTIENHFSVQLLQPIETLLKGYDAGEFSSYYELTTRGSLELKP
ncbi:MAG TPA: hypothetical protein PKC13_14580 [Blastocatellia bacterium]|nr:hypothetical protein [Blastocatellia bacterium]HMV84565.1 hypothetical protein [Blastocatellia bacterium]HMX26825.1 hypothetical protein [Blastocatellia bacterium]HNG32672.1 hypothetical protein [Blastocatellia bacterium]